MPSAPAVPRSADRPTWWPHFSSTLRSTALTARLGRVLGIAVGICFLTGLLSYYQYLPWSWLPNPATPAWGYRLTQGLHVATGTAIIPLLLIKLWSVYPTCPVAAFRSVRHARSGFGGDLGVVGARPGDHRFLQHPQLVPVSRDFATVQLYLASCSSVRSCCTSASSCRHPLRPADKVAAGDVLTEVPWNENPESQSNAGPLPPP